MRRFILDANAWFQVMHKHPNHAWIQGRLDELTLRKRIEIVYSMSNFAEMAPEWGYNEVRANAFLNDKILRWCGGKLLFAASDVAGTEKDGLKDLPESFPYYFISSKANLNMWEVHQEVQSSKSEFLQGVSEYYNQFRNNFAGSEAKVADAIEEEFCMLVTTDCARDLNCSREKAEQSVAWWHQSAARIAHYALRFRGELKEREKHRKGDLYDHYLLAESAISNCDAIVTEDEDFTKIIEFVGRNSKFKPKAVSFDHFVETIGQLL
jgi:predicted nucleic acid-binding protein